MRRRGRTFAKSRVVLAKECQLSTCPSNIHHFLKLRTRKAKLAKRASLTSGDTSEVASQHATGSAVLLPTPSNRGGTENRGAQTAQACADARFGKDSITIPMNRSGSSSRGNRKWTDEYASVMSRRPMECALRPRKHESSPGSALAC